jgi:hypothetical protein
MNIERVLVPAANPLGIDQVDRRKVTNGDDRGGIEQQLFSVRERLHPCGA